MIGISYTPLPSTAAEYINEIWKAYVGSRDLPQWLVIYVSPELYKLYSDGCKNNTLYCNVNSLPVWEPKLMFRNARVKQDPDLQGHKIRLLEDRYAWER